MAISLFCKVGLAPTASLPMSYKLTLITDTLAKQGERESVYMQARFYVTYIYHAMTSCTILD